MKKPVILGQVYKSHNFTFQMYLHSICYKIQITYLLIKDTNNGFHQNKTQIVLTKKKDAM